MSQSQGRLVRKYWWAGAAVLACGLGGFYVAGKLYAEKRINDAENLVRNTLTDPVSAQFRIHGTNPSFVCGDVNAKNRYGGYVGYRPFIVALSQPNPTAFFSGGTGPQISILERRVGLGADSHLKAHLADCEGGHLSFTDPAGNIHRVDAAGNDKVDPDPFLKFEAIKNGINAAFDCQGITALAKQLVSCVEKAAKDAEADGVTDYLAFETGLYYKLWWHLGISIDVDKENGHGIGGESLASELDLQRNAVWTFKRLARKIHVTDSQVVAADTALNDQGRAESLAGLEAVKASP